MSFALSRQAQDSLDSIWDYYFQQGGTVLADRILASIRDGIDLIVANPGLGHFRPDLTDRPLRFYRVYHFFVIYDPASNPLYIARVYHAAQDIEARLRNESE